MTEAVGGSPSQPVNVMNRAGRGRVMLVCDHASNFVPPEYGTLGLEPAELARHIAWDPGAMEVSSRLSRRLDAPLVASGVSRLVVDCNRSPDAPDLIPEVSETTAIPGNAGLDPPDRSRRIGLAHQPFHAAVDGLLNERLARGQETWLISIHSFTRIYKGAPRPWHVGILHDDDTRLSAPMIATLRQEGGLTVGDNQPYSPADRVYYTLERHGRARGLPCVMIEIRNDLIADAAGQRQWADRLARTLETLTVDGTVPARPLARTA